MAKNQFLNWEKVKNCQKCNFTKKKDLFDIFKFSGFFLHCIENFYFDLVDFTSSLPEIEELKIDLALELPEMQFHEDFFYLIDFTSFLPGLF